MEIKKYALVTGASSGLGFATASKLRGEGYIVFAGIRNESDKGKFAEISGIVPVSLDITNKQQIETAYQFIFNTTEICGLAILINNAGINYISAFELADENKERQLIEVNLLGAMSVTRRMLPLLHCYYRVTGKKGKIINISSVGGIFGLPWEAAYHASKFAMRGFSQSLHYELEMTGVSVCCFMPGGMKTEIFKKSVNSFEQTGENHSHFAYYKRNICHMKTVMKKFERKAVPVYKAADLIVRLVKKDKMPVWKYFGTDTLLIRLFTWLNLQGILKKRFTIK